MNLPNILTTFRLLLIPVFVWLILSGYSIPAAAIFILAGLTDILDGYIARKYNLITDFGKLYDPLADKLMQIAAIICMCIMQMIPQWVIIVIIAKESIMIIGSLILFIKKTVVYAKWYGKAATAVFYASILLLIILKGASPLIINIMSAILLISAIFSALAYIANLTRGDFSAKPRSSDNLEGNDKT